MLMYGVDKPKIPFSTKTQKAKQLSESVYLREQTVFKVYDYTSRGSILPRDRRHPNFKLLQRFYQNAVLVVSQPDFTLVKYDYRAGTHWPKSPAQCAKLIQLVQVLHDSSWIHGDIRLPNIVFDNDKNDAFLLDFDFAREFKLDEPPSEYITDFSMLA